MADNYFKINGRVECIRRKLGEPGLYIQTPQWQSILSTDVHIQSILKVASDIDAMKESRREMKQTGF